MTVPSRNRTARGQRAGAFAYAAVVACAAAVAGCGGGSTKDFSEISLLPDAEDLEEIQLGGFLVPVPVFVDSEADRLETSNLLQLDFELVAIVAPRHASQIEQLKKRHRGKLRDEVIRVCRNTSRDEILESESATLKAHLLDALQPILGGSHLRGLAIPRWIVEPL